MTAQSSSVSVASAHDSTETSAVTARGLLARITSTGADVGPLVARVALGLAMFPHGAQKALGWFGGYGFSGTMGFFTGQLGIPAVFAALAIAAEFLGAIGLIVGGLSRIAAFGIAATMAVAASWSTRSTGSSSTGPAARPATASSTRSSPSGSRSSS